MAGTIRAPDFGITGMPPGERAVTFPDMEHTKLEGAIETEGARLAWSRAADCPCAPVNDQTRQVDPNCPLCKGIGVIYFGPRNYVPPIQAGTLTDVQKAILEIDGAAVIRGVVARNTSESDLYDVLGRWMWGVMNVTVRPDNKIGYYDRLVSLDSEMVYFETITSAAGSVSIPLRYRATGINLVRSLSTVFVDGADYKLNSDGTLEWFASAIPTSDTILSVHYLMHPTWRVIDHPHVIREIARRRNRAPVVSSLGTPTPLPIQAKIRLEFLPVPEGT